MLTPYPLHSELRRLISIRECGTDAVPISKPDSIVSINCSFGQYRYIDKGCLVHSSLGNLRLANGGIDKQLLLAQMCYYPIIDGYCTSYSLENSSLFAAGSVVVCLDIMLHLKLDSNWC